MADSLQTLLAVLMQQPAVRAAMDQVMTDIVLYGAVRPETEDRVQAAVQQATSKKVDNG